MHWIGVVSILGVLTVTSGRAAEGPPQEMLHRMRTQARSSSSQPVSPVALVSWITTKGSDGMVLDLAVVWRGSPGWFYAPGPRQGSGGGSTNAYTMTEQIGNVRVELTVTDSPRSVMIGTTPVELGGHNVVLVDGVDDPAGFRVIKSLTIDPVFANRREIEAVLGRSPEVVAFLRCDLKLDKPAQQNMIDIFCGRLVKSR
jgi:hypothetical protein